MIIREYLIILILFTNILNAYELSETYKSYLTKKKEITVCIDPNWMPFEKFDKNGNHIGISSDYFKLFEKQLNIPFKIVKTKTWSESLELLKKRECDVLSLGNETPSRKKYLNFTTPYLVVPFVMVTKYDVTFIDNFKLLNDEKIAIVKNNAIATIVKNKFPNFNIVEVSNNKEAIQMVQNNEVFGYVANMLSIGYRLKEDFITELKIINKLENESSKLAVGVRNDDPILFKIFQDLVSNIDEKTNQDILNKYISIKFEKEYSYDILWKILFFVLLTYGIFWYKQYILKKSHKKLKEAYLQIEKKNKELERLSVTDTLTSLYNRSKLDNVLLYEIDRSSRYEDGFGLILVDVDHFKLINDTFGHQVGDQVLIEIANILKNSIRKTDIVGRWGGEEFMIVCPGTDIKGLMKLSENIRSVISNFDFKQVGKKTASFGITVYKKGDTDDSMIFRADEALYKAKNTGRDKVVIDI